MVKVLGKPEGWIKTSAGHIWPPKSCDYHPYTRPSENLSFRKKRVILMNNEGQREKYDKRKKTGGENKKGGELQRSITY